LRTKLRESNVNEDTPQKKKKKNRSEKLFELTPNGYARSTV